MENSYKTILKQAEFRFTERKSEFIGTACPVSSEEEVVGFINMIKSRNRKAAHNCYAYILRESGVSRYSDDNEPGGTAGVPIYDAIFKENLTDTAVVVTRYFGGILLGAGGLVRAYSTAASKAVSAAGIRNMILAERLELCVDYSLYGRLASVFSEYGVKINEENFAENVKINLFVKKNFSDDFSSKLTDVCNGKVIVNKLQNEMLDFG